MPPGGERGGEGEQGYRAQGADVRSDSQPSFPAFEMKMLLESLPGCCTEQDHSPSTGNGDAPSLPTTDVASETKQEQEQHSVGSLPTDVLLEILPRVPYRSLCRFKCVSKPWLAFCSDPGIRKRCPQTLSVFFYEDRARRFSFQNLSGRGPPMVDPSLPFLSGSYDHFEVEQCCGGLLLCECWKWRHEADEYDYVVCNPMTGQWVVLPPVPLEDEEDDDLTYSVPTHVFLGFDTAVPSRFTVFAPLTNYEDEFSEMAIYSSKTGRWITVETDPTILVGNPEQCVFLNGTMHISTNCGSLVMVDAEGEDWAEISMPDCDEVSIGQSQGQLHAWQIYTDDEDYGDGESQLFVWVLTDCNTGKWKLKHDIYVRVSKLFRRKRGEDDFSYTAFAIHPESNCIFLTDNEEMTLSYDMDKRKVKVMRNFPDFRDALPYVPCFAEWSSDGH